MAFQCRSLAACLAVLGLVLESYGFRQDKTRQDKTGLGASGRHLSLSSEIRTVWSDLLISVCSHPENVCTKTTYMTLHIYVCCVCAFELR